MPFTNFNVIGGFQKHNKWMLTYFFEISGFTKFVIFFKSLFLKFFLFDKKFVFYLLATIWGLDGPCWLKFGGLLSLEGFRWLPIWPNAWVGTAFSLPTK